MECHCYSIVPGGQILRGLHAGLCSADQQSPTHLPQFLPLQICSCLFVTCHYSCTARAGEDVRDPAAQSTHFSGEETEAEGGERTSLRSHSQSVRPGAGIRALAGWLEPQFLYQT